MRRIFLAAATCRGLCLVPAVLAAAWLVPAVSGGAQVPRQPAVGTLTEKVVCLSDATQTYTLFLPSAYRPDRQWPALFIFDPRGRGTLAARVFLDAAERYGWILASSDNTRSDGPWEPNGRALQAMWPDVRSRYSADPRRLYAAGFSGGGSVAWVLGREIGGLAGVIGSGMRVPTEPGGHIGTFAFFGASGRDDVNALELKNLDLIVARRGDPHRLELFDGPHRWLPSDVATRAIEWFEALAMRQERRPRDERLINELIAKEMSRAGNLEHSGELLEALRLYRVIDEAFSGVGDVTLARSRVAALEKHHLVADAQKAEKKWDDYQRRKLAEVSGVLQRLHKTEGDVLPRAALNDLGVPDLEKQARKSGPEGHAAQGVIEFLFVQTSSYIPLDLIAANNLQQAAFFLSIAGGIKDDRLVAYNLATIWSRLGQKRKALESLSHAIDLGFTDTDIIEKDSDLDPIRGDAAFKELMTRLRKQDRQDTRRQAPR